MSHANTGGESPPILRGLGKRKMKAYRFAPVTISKLIDLAKSKGLNITQYLEDLILRQKIKK